MQFHLNGFQPGDPTVFEPAEGRATNGTDDLPEEVDVLIVGCGPAGLTLAAQLAAFPEVDTAIIEQKPARMTLGQADGIACRTMEVFEALGFSERVLKEAYWVNETTFWKLDETRSDVIVRSGRIQDTEDGLSEFPHVILNQARVHDMLLDVMRNSPMRLAPHYSCRLIALKVDPGGPSGEGGAEFPVTATIERVDAERAGQIEVVRAQYVAGCDGAHSTVRKAIGRTLRGDAANQAWGVMDILAVTDFPDVRLKTLIQSSEHGSLLIIPREGGYLVRMYIQLGELDENERVTSRNITVDQVIAAAQRVLRPYDLDVKEVAWWSVYEIGQRLTDRFDDVPEDEVGLRLPRVFITGDACHTHSPKAGQGMNVSIRDSFNLGWKLASVLLGRSSPTLLRSYSAERWAVAKELIDFDREFAQKMASAPAGVAARGEGGSEFQDYFVRQGRYTAGTTMRYHQSDLCAAPTHQGLAAGLPIGMRFHSAPVTRLADAKPVQLGHVIKADGRWRLFAFADAGDPTATTASMARLCAFLADDAGSPIGRHTPPDADIDSVIDVRAVFQQDHRSLAVEEMPAFLLPRKGRYGLKDYEKMFCAASTGAGDIFDMRGIDRSRGCLVVVRPDQHIANVLPLHAYAELSAFFERILLPVARGR